MCLRRGFVFVAIAISVILMTMFSPNGVSTVIVCGVYFVIVPCGIIFHCGASVGRGSFALRAILFRATWRLFTIIVVVLSSNVKWISEGVF